MARVDALASVTGTVWKIEKNVGDSVSAGDEVMILESMKMEIVVEAPAAGKIVELTVAEQDPVDEDQVVAVIETDG